jgi:hypothetical protein
MSKKEETTDEEKQKQIATIIEALKRQNITPAPGSAAALAAAGIGNGSDPTKSAQESELHAFWDTQPMMENNDSSSLTLHAPIIPNKPASELRQTPYNMPKGFEWAEIDMSNEEEKNQL